MQLKFNQKTILITLKLLIALGSFGYIGYIYSKTPDFFLNFFNILNSPDFFKRPDSIVLAFFLVPANWAIEAIKWQYLAAKLEKITFLSAMKGVLAGLCLGFITPHALGDYVGRMYFMQLKQKLNAIGAILLARISLFYVTLFYGVMGFLLIFGSDNFATNFYNINTIIALSFIFLIFFFLIFNYEYFSKYFIKIKFYARFIHPYIKIIGDYTISQLCYTFVLSFFRYVIFTIQYLLILDFFEVDAFNVLVAASVCLIFFTKSIFPSFNFLSDVGIREAAALFFLGNIGIAQPTIIVASLIVWLINILIPSLAGLVIILGSNYSKNSYRVE